MVPPRGRIPATECRSSEMVSVGQPAETVADADDLVPAPKRSAHDCADRRVEAGAVASTGEDAESGHRQ